MIAWVKPNIQATLLYDTIVEGYKTQFLKK